MAAPNIVQSSLGIATLLAAGVCRQIVSFPIALAGITAAGDVVTNYTMGFKGRIISLTFAVQTVVTTAAKAASLNAEIGTTDLTGGVVALTSANCTPAGALVAGSAVTANNAFTATGTVSIEAASVTAFAEGSGVLLVTIVNDDTLDALAKALNLMNQ